MDPNSVQVQHLQLLQQNSQRQGAGFAGYAPAFVAPPLGLSGMQPDYPYAGMQYGMQYPLQPAEKQQVAAAAPEPAPKAESEAPPAKVSRASKKASEKNGTTYASRHQAAESRRRQRINDRLDILRKVVPHRDRANTAAFLEEVIAYVLGLKKRLAEVEGVSEADLQVPAVDVQPVLNGTAVTASALPAPATVMGNPTASSSATPQGGEHRPGGTAMGGPVPMGAVAVPAGGMPHMMPPFRDVAIGGPAEQDAVGGVAKGLNTARGLPTPAMNPNQVLVPVALMQPDQGAIGGQAYMLVNRDDFPGMMAGQGMLAPGAAMPPGEEHKMAHDESLMDVLVGAANCVAGGQDVSHGARHHHDADAEDEEDEESKAVEKQPLTTRSGRKRNPSRTF